MNKFKVRMKNPVFDAIKVDQEFLDNPIYDPYIWNISGEIYVDNVKVNIDDWIVFVHDENDNVIPQVITDRAFRMFYEVVEDTA